MQLSMAIVKDLLSSYLAHCMADISLSRSRDEKDLQLFLDLVVVVVMVAVFLVDHLWRETVFGCPATLHRSAQSSPLTTVKDFEKFVQG